MNDGPDVHSERVAELISRIRSGERRAVAEVVTALETAAPQTLSALTDAMRPHLTGVPVIGITGPPGAGKSTLVNVLIETWRRVDRRVAVVAVDPSSPVSGGAILGDRIRMSAAFEDDGVFVRSLGSAGHLGGLSPAAVRIIDAFDVAKFDLVVLETVGTGQNEIDIAEVADVAVVVAAPGLGDGIQAMKSGLLEIADILVVNKSDRPDANQTAEQLAAAVTLRGPEHHRTPPAIEQTIATSGVGIDTLALRIDERIADALAIRPAVERRQTRSRYVVERLLVASLRKALIDAPDTWISDVVDGRIASKDAIRALLTQDQRL